MHARPSVIWLHACITACNEIQMPDDLSLAWEPPTLSGPAHAHFSYMHAHTFLHACNLPNRHPCISACRYTALSMVPRPPGLLGRMAFSLKSTALSLFSRLTNDATANAESAYASSAYAESAAAASSGSETAGGTTALGSPRRSSRIAFVPRPAANAKGGMHASSIEGSMLEGMLGSSSSSSLMMWGGMVAVASAAVVIGIRMHSARTNSR